LFGLAFPNFALGPVLILFFSIYLGLLPVSGRGGPSYYILPAATLGAALAAILRSWSVAPCSRNFPATTFAPPAPRVCP
jgi:ABC-type dipeptide/oligopeptide/nickel transport system permease component